MAQIEISISEWHDLSKQVFAYLSKQVFEEATRVEGRV